LIVTLLLGSVFYINESDKLFKFGIVYSIIVSFFSFYISFDITIVDNIYYYIFVYLKIHLLAVVLSLCFKKELDMKNTVVFLFSIIILACIFELSKYKFIDKINFSKELSTGIEQYVTDYVKTLENTGLNFDSEQVYNLFFKVKDIILLLYPSFVVIASLIEAYMIYFLSRTVIGSVSRKGFTDDFRLRNFYIGKSLSFIVLIFLLVSTKDSMFENVVYNFTLIASFLYFINGFAVVEYMLNKVIKRNLMLYICMFFILIVSFVTVILLPTINGISIMFIIGITDSSFDYRKLRPKKFFIK